jgi:hypothetical protein
MKVGTDVREEICPPKEGAYTVEEAQINRGKDTKGKTVRVRGENGGEKEMQREAG